jgi:hypothetical protein
MMFYTTTYQAFRAYLQAQLQHFDQGALWSPRILQEGGRAVASWAVLGFSLVCLAHFLREHLPSAYLEAAIAEGIGPHLWNIFGTLACMLFGAACLFPRSRWFAQTARRALVNTHAVGALTLGLLLGQLVTAFPAAAADIPAWKAWRMGGSAALLAATALLLNFSLWYLGDLMASRERGDGFLHRMEKVAVRLRLLACAMFAVLPVAFLLMEK